MILINDKNILAEAATILGTDMTFDEIFKRGKIDSRIPGVKIEVHCASSLTVDGKASIYTEDVIIIRTKNRCYTITKMLGVKSVEGGDATMYEVEGSAEDQIIDVQVVTEQQFRDACNLKALKLMMA